MPKDDRSIRNGVPAPFVTVGFIASGLALLLLGWGAYHSYTTTVEWTHKRVQVEHLCGRVRYLDEVTTNAARMAVTTGSEAWARLYQTQREEGQKIIAGAIALLPAAQRDRHATRLLEALDRSFAMERTAMERLRAGKQEIARKMLFGPEYEQLKNAFEGQIDNLDRRLRSIVSRAIAAEQDSTALFSALLLAVALMVSVGWWLALRSLNRWRVTLARHNRRLAMQAKDLRQSNWALDQMVAERTRSLETQNRALQEHQEELEIAKEKAETANRAKDNFLSNISHELKTPLTSILSYSRLLHEFCDDESADVRREFLEVITTETERLTRLINDVLDFSMIEMGRIALKKRRFKFEEIAIQSLNGIAGLCLQKDVRFQLDCRTEAWSYGDPDRIQQVIANLLSNAWKFSPRDGVIRLTLAEVDGFVEIRVIDQGPGVPDQQKSYVFEKFTQGGDMLTAKPQGTGLGLSIAQTLVEAHDGTLHCEDNPSGGAVFVIRLPVQPEADEVRIRGRG